MITFEMQFSSLWLEKKRDEGKIEVKFGPKSKEVAFDKVMSFRRTSRER